MAVPDVDDGAPWRLRLAAVDGDDLGCRGTPDDPDGVGIPAQQAAVALALGATLALGACAGGQLAPEAVPYVAPVVSACPLVCDAAGDECADQAAALADESERRWASLGCAVGRSACLTGCEEAASRVGSAP